MPVINKPKGDYNPFGSLMNAILGAKKRQENVDLPVNGRVEVGNIPLIGRPEVPNNGGMSTVYSMSFVDEDPKSKNYGLEIVVPRADEGRIFSEDEAREKYYRKGQHLGTFTNPVDASKFAEDLHRRYEQDEFVPQRQKKQQNSSINRSVLGM